jgi:hypothetical protein
VAPTWRPSCVDFVLPHDGARLDVQAIHEVMQHDFVRHFDVARIYPFQNLLLCQSLLGKFRSILIAVLGSDLRQLRLTFRGYSCQQNLIAGNGYMQNEFEQANFAQIQWCR